MMRVVCFMLCQHVYKSVNVCRKHSGYLISANCHVHRLRFEGVQLGEENNLPTSSNFTALALKK